MSTYSVPASVDHNIGLQVQTSFTVYGERIQVTHNSIISLIQIEMEAALKGGLADTP